MKKDEILVVVKKILKEELNRNDIADEASQENLTEWDSLAYMAIVSRLESEFNLQITPANIQKFNSISSIVEQIDK